MPTMLVVDDDVDVQRFITVLATRRGYRVLTSGDGLEGVTLARKSAPDLMLIDINLPTMDGLTAIATLRDDPVAARFPIIVMSGDQDLLDRGLSSGADAAIAKPFDTPLLLGHIARLAPSAGAGRR